MKRERKRNLALVALVLDLRIEMAKQADPALIAEANGVALRQLFRRAHQRLPARAVEPLDQRGLDFRFGVPADAAAFELGGDHPGVVHYQLIAGLQPQRQIGNRAVAQDGVGLHHQEPRRIARAHRTQRNGSCGKFEIEEIGAHGAMRSSIVRQRHSGACEA